MANQTETNVNLKINRVPDKATLEDMVANNQIQPNQLYMLPSELGSGVVTMQTKALWTNPSPSSSFAEQTITVEDMSPYDYCMLVYKNRIDNTHAGNDVHLFQANINGIVDIESTSQGTLPTCRYLIINSMTSITVEPNYSNQSQQINNYAIPLKIIGIKLIESPTQITNKYSTEETVVGEWIDGKKIYRRVFTFQTSFNVSNSAWYDTGISILNNNISRVINCMCLSNNNLWPVMVASDFTNLNLLSCRQNTSSTNINCIILEYTKTTD